MSVIRKKKVSEEVFEQIKQMIVSGQWTPGERLPSEKDLMELFNVSRIPIRESLKQLVALGLVETRRGTGTFVRKFNGDSFSAHIQPVFTQALTKQDVLYILELRQIEVIAVGLAAEHSSKEEVEKLQQIQANMEVEQLDYRTHHEADLEFHMQICKMTANPYFFQVCRLLYDALNPALASIVRIMGPQKALYYHPRLIDTIANQYVHEARAIMREHLSTTEKAVKAMHEDSDVFLQRSSPSVYKGSL